MRQELTSSMCGIFGYIGNIQEQLSVNCINKLSHRGPDGMGIWRTEDVTLGHRRLSILDLSTKGAQPMTYGDGRYRITYNGEIYNFLELRNELQKSGFVFTSDSDTEVVLAAFVKWGEQCLEKFNGMWAFAIWDEKDKALFLCRDRFGKKPLFYAEIRNDLAFGSEMKALFPVLPAVRPNVELVKGSIGSSCYESTEECVIDGIRRFPAGHYGWWKNGRLSLHRWWCTLDHLPTTPVRYEEQVEMFRELFMDACRLRMRSDVPVGTALSGGLDSSAVISAVAHIARSEDGPRVSKDWQHAFVACFPGTPLDESRYARMVTDHIGIEATFLDIDPLKAIDQLNDYLYLFEDIYLTSPIPFMMLYGAMKYHNVKVTIDGHGADELFGGYSFNYVNALSDSGFDIRSGKMILDTYFDSLPNDSDQFVKPNKSMFWLKLQSKRMAKWMLNRPGISSPDSCHPRWSQLDTLNKVLYASTHETTLPTLLRNYDRYSMAKGVEIRMPFMDHRLVSLAFSIPWASKIRNGYAKAIIRDAMSPLLPHEIAYRKSKIGFNSPMLDWMRGPLKPFFLDIISSDSFKTCELIDSPDVANKIKRVISYNDTSFTAGVDAWMLLSPYLWEQAVIKRSRSQ